MISRMLKYINNKKHLEKRVYERLGNYTGYLKKPQRIVHRTIAKKYADIVTRTHEIQKLQAAVSHHELYGKYRRFNRYFALNFRRVFDLGLDKCSKLNILDIGCGGGFFLYISRMYGHTPHGIDMATTPLYNDMINSLGIPRLDHCIEPQQAIPPLGKKFDLITAFAICFHKVRRTPWNSEEWKFFLDDMQTNFVKKGGKMHLFFNNDPHGDFQLALENISQSGYKITVEHKTINIQFD